MPIAKYMITLQFRCPLQKNNAVMPLPTTDSIKMNPENYLQLNKGCSELRGISKVLSKGVSLEIGLMLVQPKGLKLSIAGNLGDR